MPITIQKRENESSDQLLVRFNKSSSRFVKKARRSRYLTKKPSAYKKKIAAVIREDYRAKASKRRFYS